MRITLVGSRHFGVTTLNMLRQHGVEIAGVVVADPEDRLAAAARAAGIEVRVQADPKRVAASEIADRTDLIVTVHVLGTSIAASGGASFWVRIPTLTTAAAQAAREPKPKTDAIEPPGANLRASGA